MRNMPKSYDIGGTQNSNRQRQRPVSLGRTCSRPQTHQTTLELAQWTINHTVCVMQVRPAKDLAANLLRIFAGASGGCVECCVQSFEFLHCNDPNNSLLLFCVSSDFRSRRLWVLQKGPVACCIGAAMGRIARTHETFNS